ncbi:MAG: tRNA (adenosine(37)-N6)-dimethylallyltransferase MiaA [Phycisphaerales bacterium]|nr:tRNA (adenosine(37)-N6)-dimethylallyltransferase MiaA [Phycisphaerales bacterium]
MIGKPIVIVGCTASGKSDLGEAIAERLGGGGGRIMAVDSMQVYRGMDIGTAKPDTATRRRIEHLMIDVADPWETYSAARFVETARMYLVSPSPNDKPLVIVAGTMLYLRSLMEGMFEGPGADETLRAELTRRAEQIGAPALHAEMAKVDSIAAGRIHPNDLRRIVRALEVYKLTGTPISTLQTQWTREHPAVEAVYLGIRREKESLNRRINLRVKKMLEQGLVEEVRRLAEDQRGGGISEEAASAVGYRQLLDHFARKCSLEEAIEQIKIQTRYLAKMQRTWLKRWPPPNTVHWLDAAEDVGGGELADQAMTIVTEEARSQKPEARSLE